MVPTHYNECDILMNLLSGAWYLIKVQRCEFSLPTSIVLAKYAEDDVALISSLAHKEFRSFYGFFLPP